MRDSKQAPLAVRMLHESLLWRALLDHWVPHQLQSFVEHLCSIVVLAAEYAMLVRTHFCHLLTGIHCMM